MKGAPLPSSWKEKSWLTSLNYKNYDYCFKLLDKISMGGTRHFNVIIFPARRWWPYSISEHCGASTTQFFSERTTLPVRSKKLKEMVKKAWRKVDGKSLLHFPWDPCFAFVFIATQKFMVFYGDGRRYFLRLLAKLIYVSIINFLNAPGKQQKAPTTQRATWNNNKKANIEMKQCG